MLPRLISLIVFGLALSSTAFSQAPDLKASPSKTSAEEKPAKVDPLGRDTPKGTVIGFIKAAGDEDFQRAIHYIDARQVPKPVRDRIQELLVVLNHGLLASDVDQLSNKPEGEIDDDLPPKMERVGTVKSDSASLEILLERFERHGQQPIWRFSKATLKGIPGVYQEIRPIWVERFLWPPLKETRLLNVPLWMWLAFPLTLILVVRLSRLLSRFVFALFRPLMFRLMGEHARDSSAYITAPIRILALGVVSMLWLYTSHLPLLARITVNWMAFALGVVGLSWLLMRLIDIAKHGVEDRLRRLNEPGGIAITHLTAMLVKITIIALGALTLLYHFDVDLTTALAGLGIGGIAVAFAAQKTLENLFGGIMVISDQPIRVGDFCKAGDVQGTVESIGLRSTRIRTLNRTVVSVPNGQMATANLENYGFRDKGLFQHTLGLRFETSADQMRYVLAEIRRMFYEHPMVETETARIRFVRFGGSSLELDIFAYVLSGEIARILELQEDLLLRIMDIVEASGTGFAFPSSTTYLARDVGLNKEKTREAIATVGRWRDERELPFPDFHPSQISEIRNRIEYPPPGSAIRKPKAPK